MKRYLYLIGCVCCFLSGCNIKSESVRLHSDAIGIYVTIYENYYIENNQLDFSVKKIEETDIIGNKKERIAYEEKLLYTYNNNGDLIKTEIYDIETDRLEEYFKYDNDTIINCSFYDSDTLYYRKELRDKSGNVLFGESKNKPLIEGLIPSHFLIRNTYDDAGRQKTYIKHDLLNNKTEEYYFYYKTINDTLVAEVFDKKNNLFEYIYWTKNDSIDRMDTYNHKMDLEETEETYKILNEKIWVATYCVNMNSIDSVFYNSEGKQTKYIHKSDGYYYSKNSEYDKYGNLSKEVEYKKME